MVAVGIDFGTSTTVAAIHQGDRVEVLKELSYTPREPWEFWGPRQDRERIEMTVGTDSIKGLKDGDYLLNIIDMSAMQKGRMAMKSKAVTLEREEHKEKTQSCANS